MDLLLFCLLSVYLSISRLDVVFFPFIFAFADHLAGQKRQDSKERERERMMTKETQNKRLRSRVAGFLFVFTAMIL